MDRLAAVLTAVPAWMNVRYGSRAAEPYLVLTAALLGELRRRAALAPLAGLTGGRRVGQTVGTEESY